MDSAQSAFTVPFPSGYRASGVLLHVTSLPSRYGIGDVGPSAFAWVDRLADAGQGWWQLLPLGPTGEDNSPYKSMSSFAANPLITSPDQLIGEGLLTPGDCEEPAFPSDWVDFERVIPFKERLLAIAWRNFQGGARPDLREPFEEFCEGEAEEQKEAALFMALQAEYEGVPFQEWPGGLALREGAALAQARRESKDAVRRFHFGQFMLLRHWRILKDYANRRGVRLLGDLPIFVSPDSSDVWANPELFLLDDQANPRVIAGVPPDYFSADGQVWGNPVYDWDRLKQTGYRWWIDRFQVGLDYVDAMRLDHFRGFEAAWHVPFGATTAKGGQWVDGPGEDFFAKMRQSLGRLPLLAEDLGDITPAVTALRDLFQLPGMRVLQFGFNGDPGNIHLPHHCPHNSVAYTGTHDNDTTRGWYDTLSEAERRNFWNYLQRSPGEPAEAAWELIRLAWSSPAALALTPLQDLLGLGSAARMNLPGRAEGQWRWRCTESVWDNALWPRLGELTRTMGRVQ